MCKFEGQVTIDCQDCLCRCLSVVFCVLCLGEVEGIFLIVSRVCDARKC